MISLYFDGPLARIYEVPENSTFTVDGNGYRIYTPIDLQNAADQTSISTTELWSRYVDWNDTEDWYEKALEKNGGAFRFQDNDNNDVFATFDLRLINGWEIVLANYPHQFLIDGNLFENLSTGRVFDNDRITSPGVQGNVFYSDSLQRVVVSNNQSTQLDQILTLLENGSAGQESQYIELGPPNYYRVKKVI